MFFPDLLKPTVFPKPSGTLLEQLQRNPHIGGQLANATLVAWSDLDAVRQVCLGFGRSTELAEACAVHAEIAAEVVRITGVATNVALILDRAWFAYPQDRS